MDRVFTVADLRMKDTSLTVSADGGLEYATTQKFDPTRIDTFHIEPVPVLRQQSVGVFRVDVPPFESDPLSFDEIFGSPPPSDTVFPPASFTLPARDFHPAASFEYVEFDSGLITLTITNTLPFPIQFTDPVTVRNNIAGDTSVVASFLYPDPVGPNGGTRTSQASLVGVTVRSALRILPVNASTTGGTGTIEPGEGLEFGAVISGARVKSARSTIPPQIIPPQTRTFVLDDSVTLASAVFRGGSMMVEIRNGVDVSADIAIRFNEMTQRSGGATYVLTHHFDGTGTHARMVDMSALEFTGTEAGTGTTASFRIEVTLTGNSTMKEVRSTDEVEVSIAAGSPIRIETVRGRIPPTPLSVATGASGFTLGELADKFEGSVAFDSIRIAIQLQTSSGFPADYDVYFVGMDRRGVPVVIDSIRVPPPAESSQRRIFPARDPVTTIVLDNTTGLNTFLSKFFPHFPDTFMIRGSMTLNPPDVYAAPDGLQTVYDSSRVYSSVDVLFPVRIGISNATIRDSVPLLVREKFPRDLAKSTRTATMFFAVENGLPFTVQFRAALLGPGPGGPRDTLLMIPTDGVRVIQAGVVAAATGLVTTATVSEFAMEFTGPEAERFGDGENLLIQLDVETPDNGSIVKVRDTDAVRVRASGHLQYHVNKP